MRQPPRQLPSVVAAGNLGATYDLAVSPGRESWVTGTLNANCAITTRGDVAGAMFYLLLTQDATGARTVSINGTSIVIPRAPNATVTIVGRYGATWDYQTMLGVDAVDIALAATGFEPFVSGWVYEPVLQSTFVPSIGELRVMPFTFAVPVVLSGLTVDFSVAGSADSIFIPVLYNDDGNGYPSTVALTGQSVSTGTGNAGVVTTGGAPNFYNSPSASGGNVTVPAGRYFIGGASQGTTSATIRTGLFPTRILGRSGTVAGGDNPLGWRQTGWTTSPTVPPSFVGVAQGFVASIPRVGFKVA